MIKKVHILFAHQEESSFNGMLRDAAFNTLQDLRVGVTLTNLYQENFKAVADRSDFTALRDPAYFDMQTEQ